MKVSIVSITFSRDEGGAVGIAYDQAVELKKNNYDVSVFCGTYQNDSGWFNDSGISVRKIKISHSRHLFRQYICLRNFKVEKEFVNYLKKEKPEIVHFNDLYYQLPFSLIKIARSYAKKVFFTAHDVMTICPVKLNHFVNSKYNIYNIKDVNYHLTLKHQILYNKKAFNPLRNIIIRHYLRYADKIFCVSEELKKALVQNKIKNIEVVHNGLDIEKWDVDPVKVNFLKKQKKLIDKKIILFAGRLSGNKGGHLMVDMMKTVRNEIPGAIMLVLGERSAYTEQMKNYAVDKNVADKIIFNGHVPRSEMKNYYGLCDIVVVPSAYLDPFPTVNLEAMICRKPVIASCFGGSREAVNDGKTGLIVNALNSKALSEAITRLLSTPEICRRMGGEGNKLIKEKFTLARQIKKIVNFYG
ncbi:glycosyltransferase family 1 protein [Candidatus Parcubacteria bacterium]|nr:MAG: glycosyltransferase family 1 protein [Candidatus Parcubacteria bacterium]